jgi:hypothetical protein
MQRQTEIVGRTFWDFASTQGRTIDLAKFVSGIDSVEVLGTFAFVVRGIYGKQNDPSNQFVVFWILLAGYHVAKRPLGCLLRRLFGWNR